MILTSIDEKMPKTRFIASDEFRKDWKFEASKP